MTRHAREAIALAVATALGEAALHAFTITEWANASSHVLLFAFLVGPPLFLALLAWRRREHATRSRMLFIVALLIAVGGLGVLGFNFYRFSTDPQFRKTPNMTGVIVPLVQWVVIMAIWLWLVVVESREKKAAAQAGQTRDANTTNPSQSA